MILSSFSSLQSDLFYIWIWHADKIPPHIACSVGEHYFSLKAKGLDFDFPVQKALQIMERKQIPSLLVETNLQIDLERVREEFNLHKNAISEGESCLFPIKSILGKHQNIEKVADLISELEANKEIKHIFGFNLSETFKGLRSYSKEDISNRLKLLRNAER